MNNDLCLVPGAIDQYIPRAGFERLFPGQEPETTMTVDRQPKSLPSKQLITSFVLSEETQKEYFRARASVDAKQAFTHEGTDWLVVQIVNVGGSEIEIFGVPYPHGIYDWAAE